MKAHQAGYPVATMCYALEVSVNGYYAWRKRLPSARALAHAALSQRIVAIHAASNGIHGMPNIHAELADDHAVFVAQKRLVGLPHTTPYST